MPFFFALQANIDRALTLRLKLKHRETEAATFYIHKNLFLLFYFWPANIYEYIVLCLIYHQRYTIMLKTFTKSYSVLRFDLFIHLTAAAKEPTTGGIS